MAQNPYNLDRFGTFLDTAQKGGSDPMHSGIMGADPLKAEPPPAAQTPRTDLRITNLLRVLDSLRSRTPISRMAISEIQQESGLDFNTFVEVLRFLLQSNMVISIGEAGDENLSITSLGYQFSDILRRI